MKTFILYWLIGNPETIKGNDITDAVRRAGYGGGAMAALDYYEEIKEEASKKYCFCGEKLTNNEVMCPMCIINMDAMHDALDEVFIHNEPLDEGIKKET